jgi:hypothetical protein
MQSRVARMRLAQAVESQFDTSVVAAFEAILAGANAEYRNDGPEVDGTVGRDGSVLEPDFSVSSVAI